MASNIISCPSCRRHSNIDMHFDTCWNCGHLFSTEEKLPPPAPTVLIEKPPKPVHPLQTRFERQQNTNRGTEIVGGLIGAGIIIAIPIFLLNQCTSSKTLSPQELERDAQAAAEKKDFGRHCLSGWDGSSPRLVEAVKATLRNPSSFEHSETITAPRDAQGRNEVMMKFGAENGFGGMNVGYAKASMSNDNCEIRVEKIDN